MHYIAGKEASITDSVTDELLLEHMKAMQGSLTDLRQELREVKASMRTTNEHMSAMAHSIAAIVSGDSNGGGELDRIRDRIDRIERRLELNG